MADAENATRAPESDAAERQTAPSAAGDTAAQTAPAAGQHCVYISKPADYPHAQSKLLLLLTGGTGIRSTNNQLQADKFASEGFLVLMPDFLAGDTSPASVAIADDSASVLEQVKLKAAEVTKSFMLDMWLARVTPDRVMPLLGRVVDAAHEHFADAVEHGGGIYAVGYCVGGRFVLLLAQETAGADGDAAAAGGGRKKGPCIRAGALAHGASVAPDDFAGLAAPLSLVCVEDDPLFPDAVRAAGEHAMSAGDLEHEVRVYPGVPHGFAVVGAYADSVITEAQATAYEQMLKWIKEH
ncbi:hypothetical protein UVI_02034330 [Ustilaginoidea virens]|uniref:Dienelactone hydrolase domain-containing protein n=1 Tax=Ustilaginoidea virens TaxID=1159556 RepID=A0A1B5KTZ4_USTVR|nr:hypothetical protein UVI_02034330 [Ustilaginoidea virens]